MPDELMAHLMAALLRLLPPGEPCLEVGVGTGRIALPLATLGVFVSGVDISAEMLGKLVEKRPGAWPQVVVADATRLPFPDTTFGSAIASHVLHLIPGWRTVVTEMRRVVRPGGVVFASRGYRVLGAWRERVLGRFFHEAGDPPWPPGMDGIEELDAEMTALGAQREAFPDLSSEDTTSIDDVIAAMEDGLWAACWSLDDSTRRRAAAATRKWALAEYGDLKAGRAAPSGSVWRAYRLPE